MKLTLSTLLSFLMLSSTLLAQISKPEKKISAAVEAHQADALKLLEEVVNINSGSMNFEGVYKVGQIFKAKFDALGFETKWVDGKSWGRAGHLIAQHKGKGKTLLL